MAKPLVVVESPTKANTLRRYLGSGYEVMATVGHIRDLPESASEVPDEIRKQPWGRLGVDIDRDFTPIYVIPADKKRNVQPLRAALKDASELILATDPDREGESISWHLLETLKPKKGLPVRRVRFFEVTEQAIREALRDQHQQIDLDLVAAQEARRILDRLFGYSVSPVLWKKVQTGLSAGRVQSVAVRLIVEREEERRAFRSSAFWDLEARIRAAEREFTATLVRVGDRRIASGKDFNPATGALESDAVRLLDEAASRSLADALARGLPWRVSAVDERPVTQRPAPPFTTSTLQQEANRKLGFSSQRTMDAAQALFGEGHISYHRTDSTTLSDKALRESGRVIRDMFGPEYHTGPRQYQTRVRNAQEAHEAIRPTDFGIAPLQLAGTLDADEQRLYELIWKRTIASQMAEARLLRTTLEITATGADGIPATFTASGKAIQFPGFLRAYVEGSDDPAAELGDQESLLPKCTVGDEIRAAGEPARLTLSALDAKGHDTTPSARYTEASLVKRLEEDGIGRPSTYAATIATIQRRGYVFRQGKALVPSFTAFAVTRLLRDHFTEYVDVGFTAEMEQDLDEISKGERGRLEFLREFYNGTPRRPGLEHKVEQSGEIDYPVIDIAVDPESGKRLVVRIGRYGPFVQRGEGGDGHTASLPDDLPPADLTVEKALELLRAKAAGPRTLGADAEGRQVYVMSGRFGPYVQLGESPEKGSKAAKPPRASLPKGVTEDSISLEQAVQLLALPREVGRHPDDGAPIQANFGRFGPYIKHGDEFRSLDSDEEVFSVTLDRAVELLRQPKRSRRRQQATRAVLRELGPHPESGAVVKILDGRYGPYVTDGTTNASLPKGTSAEALSMEDALSLLSARAAAGPSKRRMARRASGSPKTRKRATA